MSTRKCTTTTCNNQVSMPATFKGKPENFKWNYGNSRCTTCMLLPKPVAAQQPQVSVTQTVNMPVPVSAQQPQVQAPVISTPAIVSASSQTQIQSTVPMITIPLTEFDYLRDALKSSKEENEKLRKQIAGLEVKLKAQKVKLSKSQWNASTVTPEKETRSDANTGGW